MNDFSVVSLNLTEIYMLLSQCDNQTTFTIEYDISVIGKLSFLFSIIMLKSSATVVEASSQAL